ncbi:flippase [Kamptonema cortianum]|uniref:Flippase n=1 Tax=Geitlerinema calcuttense NRMC-F 0142 TaxID=2922238 RepID=A0ABT7LXI4_9CYAN|nr:flippase [Geitlerinema calcuttense]MDK3158259.1 flippase [Kamptonema cortianum]MDL5056519.1 flippase [Geitlerinema calcuttense NRMC-F 0142]
MLNKYNATLEKLSPGLRKILGNIGWLFADRILRMGVGVIITAWLARYLGPDQFGLLNYTIAFVSLFTTLAALGLDQIVVRNIVRDPDCKAETLGTTQALKVCSGILGYILAIGAIALLRPDDPLIRLLVAIISGSLVFESLNTIDFWFQTQVQSKYTVWAKNIAFIIMTAVRILLISLQAPLVAFAWAALAESALGGIGLTVAYSISGENLRTWQVNWGRARGLLKDSWPLILSNLAIMVYLRVDQVMLGQLATDESVGIYSSATRLSEVWYFIAIAIVNSVTPSIVEAKNQGENAYYGKLQKLFNLMAGIAYAIAIPMTFLSTPLVVLVFGQEYARAGEVLSIHIWAALFTFFGWSKGVWIVTEGQTLFALVATSLGAVMNVGLNLWLIPQYREIGAAIATVISYGFTDYVMCFIYPPTRRLAWIMTKALTLSFLFRRS